MDIETLRTDLKLWERAFVAVNGRKPAKEDIKAHPTMSAQYQRYEQLRKIQKSALNLTPRKRRKQNAPGSDTPSKKSALNERSANVLPATTPQRGQKHTDPGWLRRKDSPIPKQEEQPTPAFIRCALGPTPQRDGQMLGIFDMLPSASPSKHQLDTPSKPKSGGTILIGTPSKALHPPGASTESLSRTPMSSGKRFYLDAFAGTPPKRRREDGNDGGTPSTSTKQFATPAFLRRSFPLAAIDEEDGRTTDKTSQPPPFKKRGLVRSLSSLIQGLKKQENERMDEEWDVMNEIEAEESGKTAESGKPVQTLVRDSQCVGTSFESGAERAGEAEEESTAEDADGEPRKVWKKKGLKRQTRRVIMRPVLHKPKKAAELATGESADVDCGDDTQLVEETQLADISAPERDLLRPGISEEDAHSDFENATDTEMPSTMKRKVKALDRHEKAPNENGKKTTRKSSATAHANFRALKIKNKNSKAKGRGGGRFGRRR